MRFSRITLSVLIALLAADPVTIAHAETASTVPAKTDADLTRWAMHWFTEMMAGRANRSQYAPAFAPQVTDEAVARISHDLNRYGAAPLGAEIVQTKRDGEQTFTLLKFVFPRGDATSLLFGFDAAGKVTGVAPGRSGGGLTANDRLVLGTLEIPSQSCDGTRTAETRSDQGGSNEL